MAWGQATGMPHVYSSQWSQLETGAMRNPSPGLFWNFGIQNQHLAQQQYGPITSRALMDRVKGAAAVRHPDGEPWDAADFFAAYVGLERWPLPAEPDEPVITAEAAEKWSADLRCWFMDAAAAAKLEPMEAVLTAMQHADLHSLMGQPFQRLLMGFDGLPPELLLEQWHEEADGPAEWLAAWRKTMGLPAAPPTPPWSGGGG